MGVADRDWMRERKTDWDGLGRGRASSGSRTVRGRWLLAIVVVLAAAAFALPHVAIAGRHWHLYLLP